MALNDKFNAYLKSSVFQSKFKSAVASGNVGRMQKPKNADKVDEVELSGENIASIALAQQYETEMCDILKAEFKHIDTADEELPEKFENALHSKIITRGKHLVVEFRFDDTLWRESLNPGKYPDGAYLNVLFHNGVNAQGYIYGVWHDRFVRSVKHRPASHFMYKARDEFMQKHPGCSIEIDIKYE